MLRVIQRDGLVHRAASLGDQLADRLTELHESFDVVGDVRGQGLLRGVELVTDKATKAPADRLGKAVTMACLERGLHMNIVQLPGMGGILRIAPPLTITEDELHAGLDILGASLEAVSTTATA